MTDFKTRILKTLIYPNIFIACCAVMMTWETQYLLEFSDPYYLVFVFFSTLLSYSFHSLVNTAYSDISPRHIWNLKYKALVLITLVVSALVVFSIFILKYTKSINAFLLAGLITFLYSAPNIEQLGFLKKIVFGKTIFLALVWTYATTILPVLAYDPESNYALNAFVGSRFYLVYAICILFDWRDHEEDRKKGIKALPTMLEEKQIPYFYFGSLLAAAFFSILFTWPNIDETTIFLLLPILISLGIYGQARKGDSEMLYYVYLDGLMMLSAILHAIYLFSITFVFR